MSKPTSESQIHCLGIDLAKQSIQLHGVDDQGEVVLRKKLKRSQFASFMARLPACTVAMEACGGANHWARQFSEMGHTVRIIAPQYVKPYVKTNKNDSADAEGICEAAQRPTMRFVPPKTLEQQDLQSLHRIRSQVVARRTALANQIRGLLMEYGVVITKGINHVRKALPTLFDHEDKRLTVLFKSLLSDLYDEFVHMDERIESLEKRLQEYARHDADCQRLLTIPGVGLLSATALVSAVGDAKTFGSGREMAAWLGLVPRQHSTGGKDKLGSISKRGDTYLRTLLIHGGRTVTRVAHRYKDKRNRWVDSVHKRRGANISAVAVANKNARIAWALLVNQTDFRAA